MTVLCIVRLLQCTIRLLNTAIYRLAVLYHQHTSHHTQFTKHRAYFNVIHRLKCDGARIRTRLETSHSLYHCIIGATIAKEETIRSLIKPIVYYLLIKKNRIFYTH